MATRSPSPPSGLRGGAIVVVAAIVCVCAVASGTVLAAPAIGSQGTGAADAGSADAPGTETDGNESGSEFEILEASLERTQVTAGEAFEVDFSLYNGGESGTHRVVIAADGEELTSRSIELHWNQETNTNAHATIEEPGTYRITVDDVTAGTVTVLERPDVRVVETGRNRTELAPGGTVAVTVSMTNRGGSEGRRRVSLAVDGDPVRTGAATVLPGETTTISIEHTFDTPGQYSLSVAGEEIGPVRVATAENGSDAENGTGGEDGSDDDGGGDGLPGFGPVVALLGLLGGALLARRPEA